MLSSFQLRLHSLRRQDAEGMDCIDGALHPDLSGTQQLGEGVRLFTHRRSSSPGSLLQCVHSCLLHCVLWLLLLLLPLLLLLLLLHPDAAPCI